MFIVTQHGMADNSLLKAYPSAKEIYTNTPTTSWKLLCFTLQTKKQNSLILFSSLKRYLIIAYPCKLLGNLANVTEKHLSTIHSSPDSNVNVTVIFQELYINLHFSRELLPFTLQTKKLIFWILLFANDPNCNLDKRPVNSTPTYVTVAILPSYTHDNINNITRNFNSNWEHSQEGLNICML